MARSWEEITAEFRMRKAQAGPMVDRMRSLVEVYQGDVAIPLPELDKQEKAGVANLVQTGIDQLAMRISSTLPDVRYYPEIPGQKKSENYARIRRYANLGWWTENKMRLKMRRRSRYLVGYGASPVVIRPHHEREMPWWHVRDPMSTFSPPGMDPDDINPPDCIFGFKRSLVWLQRAFPEASRVLYKGSNPRPEDLYEMIEYVDDEVFVLGVLAPARERYDMANTQGQMSSIELYRVPNRIGKCPVIIPGRINLDRRMGQFDNALGMYHWQSRLMALDLIAIEKGIFPDTFLISRPNEIAAFIDGPYDGRTGRVNVVKGGDIKELITQPSPQVGQAVDRLERSQRITGGVPAEFGGESTTNVRTGRRGDAILSAVVDFPVQEAQQIFQEALELENRMAVLVDKTYFDKPKSFFVNLAGVQRSVDYTPSTHFTSDANSVSYSLAGADINNLVVGIGQRVGIGMMSRHTGMELDPLIEDSEREHDRVVAESLEQALLQGIQQQAQQGMIAPHDVARIMSLVREDRKDLAEAVQQVQQEVQQRQATAAPQGAPETQPGIGPPSAAQPPAPSVGAPPTGLQNVTALLGALRQGQRAGAPTSVAGGGAAPGQG